MDRVLMSVGAVLVGAGFAAARKPGAAAVGVGAGLLPLLAGIVLNARRVHNSAK